MEQNFNHVSVADFFQEKCFLERVCQASAVRCVETEFRGYVSLFLNEFSVTPLIYGSEDMMKGIASDPGEENPVRSLHEFHKAKTSRGSFLFCDLHTHKFSPFPSGWDEDDTGDLFSINSLREDCKRMFGLSVDFLGIICYRNGGKKDLFVIQQKEDLSRRQARNEISPSLENISSMARAADFLRGTGVYNAEMISHDGREYRGLEKMEVFDFVPKVADFNQFYRFYSRTGFDENYR